MFILWKIGIRNVSKQKSKTIIIGTLMILGTIILFLGSSFLYTQKYFLELVHKQEYTADIIAYPKLRRNQNMSLNPVSYSGALRTVDPYKEVLEALKSNSNIQSLSPQLAEGTVLISRGETVSVEDEDRENRFLLFGVNPTLYKETFPNSFKILEGRFLEEGERGIVLSKFKRNKLQKQGLPHKVGEIISLRYTTATGVRIRDVPIIGVIAYNSESIYSDYSFIDSQSLRELKNIYSSSTEVVEIDDQSKTLLEGSEDDFFAEESFDANSENSSSFADFEEKLANTTTELASLKTADDAWYYILLRVKEGTSVEETIKELQALAEKNQWNLQFGDWKVAFGQSIILYDAAGWIGLVFVIILMTASLFIIMNTLILSILERTQEIGTMRALGAGKIKIFQLFAVESFSMTLIFGFIGVFLGFLIIGSLPYIPMDFNEDSTAYSFIRLFLVDGKVLIYPSYTGLLGTLAFMSMVGFLASLYPIQVALKVEPVVAMADK